MFDITNGNDMISLYIETVNDIDEYMSESMDNMVPSESNIDTLNKLKQNSKKIIIACSALIILIGVVVATVKKTAKNENANINKENKKSKKKQADLKITSDNAKLVIDPLIDQLQEIKSNSQKFHSQISSEIAAEKKSIKDREDLIKKMKDNGEFSTSEAKAANKQIAELKKASAKRIADANDTFNKINSSFTDSANKIKMGIAKYGTEDQYAKYNSIVDGLK